MFTVTITEFDAKGEVTLLDCNPGEFSTLDDAQSHADYVRWDAEPHTLIHLDASEYVTVVIREDGRFVADYTVTFT